MTAMGDGIRLAFDTYAYTDLQSLPVVACLERIARTGYASIDVPAANGASTDPRSFSPERRRLTRGTADRLALKIGAAVGLAPVTDGIVGARGIELKSTIDLAAELGAGVATFLIGGPQPNIAPEELWQKTTDAIKEAVAYGVAKHVSLALSGIWPTSIVNNVDRMLKLLDDVASPDFGVVFDPCALTVIGVDAGAFVVRFGARIRHVLIRDYVGQYPKFEYKLLGSGEMNYVPIFRAMAETPFHGSLAVIGTTEMKFEDACSRGFDEATDSLARAGVKVAK